MNVLQIDGEGRRTHRVNDGDVQIPVIPAQNARAVFLSERLLPVRDHGPRALPGASDISGIHQARARRQSWVSRAPRSARLAKALERWCGALFLGRRWSGSGSGLALLFLLLDQLLPALRDHLHQRLAPGGVLLRVGGLARVGRLEAGER